MTRHHRLSRHQLAGLRENLTERDVAILETVGSWRLMSTAQLERLFFPSNVQGRDLSAARACRRELARLVDAGLLRRLDRRIGGVRAGSASFVYAMAPAGQRLLRHGQPRQRMREPSAVFVNHTLAVSELYVLLREAEDHAELRLVAVQAEPECWRAIAVTFGGSWLKPDLFVQLTSSGYEYRWFVEVDLGSEHMPAIIRKCRMYDAYYRSGVEQAQHGVSPRVLWVAPDEQRAERLSLALASSRSLLSEKLFMTVEQKRAVGVLSGEQP